MIQHLHRVSNWVLADAESRTTSEALVGRILDDFGGGALFLLLGDQDKLSVKLTVASNPLWLGAVEELTAQTLLLGDGVGEAGLEGTLAGTSAWVFRHSFPAYERAYTLLAAFPGFSPRQWAPVASLHALGHLLVMGLVHHVGSYEPILPGHPGQQDLTLDPGLVIGDSQAMKQVLEQLRVAVDPDLHVLLRGEPGVGKELLARSLHLSSGSRRNGPFVVAGCGGARPGQVEADLFGAVIAGKGGAPVRREGKLALADGGTLFLDDVDQLPLDLQARLVRFLRSGEVEPMGGTEVQKVDVRLVAGSRGPLEAAVARDTFRVDLAYRLAQVTIEVPSLRDRREDLPLLIQAYVNRACHETGKRIQGITVKAMSALLNHDYPGNLAELENIARQLVYMSPTGRPVDAALLPERVRNGTAQAAARLEPGSDLDLDHLVGGTEQAAIREALKRTHGNKSQAARLLGLSRNGLATKMERYGIQG
jgi:DNA-binding NtrC family response regulator